MGTVIGSGLGSGLGGSGGVFPSSLGSTGGGVGGSTTIGSDLGLRGSLRQVWFLLKGLKWNTLFGHWNLQVAEQSLHHSAQIPIRFVLINQKPLLVQSQTVSV